MFVFTNQTVVVTGAGGNLGVAVARRFKSAGANLVLLERNPDMLPRLFPDLVDSPGAYLAGNVDATDARSVEASIQAALGRFGRVDVLVNTIGGYRGGTPLHETSQESWDFIFRLNVLPAFILARAVIPQMLKNGSGKIINVSARAALKGTAGNAAYNAAKSAVVRLTEAMAEEVKHAGINVNCILPGTIDTPQNRAERPDADYSTWVQPEALADVILFLASDAARAVHGAAIPVYGRS